MSVGTMQGPVIVTTCMGRLEHLKRSLPTWLEHTPYDVVIVTFSDCPDRTLRWASEETSSPRVNVLAPRPIGELGKPPVFNKAVALNCALRWLRSHGVARAIMLDADTLVRGDISRAETPRTMCIALPEKTAGDLTGFLAADVDALEAAGDYDEEMFGYGVEDLDLRTRLYLRSASSLALLGQGLLLPINHDDALRTKHYAEKDKTASSAQNLARMMSRLTSDEIGRLSVMPVARDILLGAELCP